MGCINIFLDNDIEVEIKARDYFDLFSSIVKLFNKILATPKLVTITKKIKLDFINKEDAIINFLNEIIYLFDLEKFLPKDIDLDIKKDVLVIKLFGGRLSDRQRVKYMLKSATYHNFVLKEDNGLFCKFIIDI